MKRIKLITLLLAVMLLALAPQATQALSLSADSLTESTCAAQYTFFVATVTNTDSEVDTYTISLSGSAANWAVAAPTGFSLAPSESRDVYVYVTPPVGALVGSYDLQITASASKSDSQSLITSLVITDCHAANLIAQQEAQSICTGEIADYTLTLTNNGAWAENYELSLSGNGAKWTTLGDTLVRLEAGATQDIAVFLNPPEGEVGEYKIGVTARSLDSDAVASAELSLNIDGCYDFRSEVPENFYSVCEAGEERIPITITNDGSATNKYYLSVDGPEWAALDRTQLTLAPARSEAPVLILTPPLATVGNTPIKVMVESDLGDLSADVELVANVLDCYGVDIEISDSSDTICPGTSNTYEVSVVNNGEFTEDFALEVSGASWASLSKNFLTLASAQSAAVDLTVDPSSTTSAVGYPITVSVRSQNTEGVSDSNTLALAVAQRDSCFGVRTEAEQSQLALGYGEGTLVPIIIENIGSESARYTLDVSGTGAQFAQLNPSVVEVDSHSSEIANLYVSVPEGTSIGKYTISIAARNEDEAVSSSSLVILTISELPQLPSLPAVGDLASNITENISLPVTGVFADLSTSIRGASNGLWEKGREYWYVAVIIVALIVLSLLIRRFKPFEDEDDDWLALIEDDDKKPAKKREKGLLQRFMEWLEEEDEDEEQKMYEPKKAGRAAKPTQGLTIVERIRNAFTEEVDERSTKPTTSSRQERRPKVTPKPKLSKGKEKGLLQRFNDWLDEDFKEPPKAKPRGRPKKEKTAWERFKDWLEEDDD